MEVLALMNAERHRVGLPPLIRSIQLDAVARYHSSNMFTHQFFAHEDHLGDGPSERVRKLLPGVFTAGSGENVAYHQGIGASEAARRFMIGFMNSPGHRANILRESFTHVGIGIVEDPLTGRRYLTQQFSVLVAELSSGQPQRHFVAGRPITLVFRYLGTFEPDELTAFVELPHEEARLPAPGGAYYRGGGPLSVEWLDGSRFTITVPTDAGVGRYVIKVGRSDHYLVDGGLSLDVR